MFKKSSKPSKEFFQKLKPGTLLCEAYSGFIEDSYLDIFEFGHFDENSNVLYWQSAIYHEGRFESRIKDLAAIRHDGKLYEQKPFGDISKCKNIRLANENERNKYYDELDCKFAWKYCQKTLTRGDLILLPPLNNKLSRIRLSVAPPEYLYVESGDSKMIFKTVPLRMESAFKGVIKYKGSIMINDYVKVSNSEEEINACDYKEATVIREATEQECAILMSRICMYNITNAPSKIKISQEEQDEIHEKYCRHLNFCKEKMKPFATKVLVSNGSDDIWRPAVFGCVSEEESKPVCVVGGLSFKYCITYIQHKELCGRPFNFSDILV